MLSACLRRGAACVLLILIVVPCTAPLGVCSLDDLWPRVASGHRTWPPATQSSVSLTEAALTHALPAPSRATRFRLGGAALSPTASLFADLRRTDPVGPGSARAATFLLLPDLILRI